MTDDAADNPSGSPALAGVLTAEQIARLKEHWIETPEQFLSAVATEEGRAGMCRLLAMDERRLDGCVKQLAERLDPGVVEQLRSTRPGGELGAILSEPPAGQDDVEQGGEA